MVPNNFYPPETFRDAQRKILPSKTFYIDFENRRLSGKVDGIDALGIGGLSTAGTMARSSTNSGITQRRILSLSSKGG